MPVACYAARAIWQDRYGRRASGGAPPAMRMALAEAMALLGVPKDFSEADVLRALAVTPQMA